MVRWLIALIFLLFTHVVFADVAAYSRAGECTTKQGTVTFSHRHDWSAKQLRTMFDESWRHERFFTADNKFSFVEARNNGKLLFHSPSPAFGLLWISPDANYFVALSGLKHLNPYQLAVWSRDGRLLHKEHVSAGVRAQFEPLGSISRRFSADFDETTTNAIVWFDFRRPEIAITLKGAYLVLSLRSPKGRIMTVSFLK